MSDHPIFWLEQIQGHIYNEANFENLWSHDAYWSKFVTHADVCHIEMIEEEAIHPYISGWCFSFSSWMGSHSVKKGAFCQSEEQSWYISTQLWAGKEFICTDYMYRPKISKSVGRNMAITSLVLMWLITPHIMRTWIYLHFWFMIDGDMVHNLIFHAI